ncbi:MAG: YitT family protein [Halanaerobiales bacterium]|nr:YitT family protein [Halanaerobiales bacterium]
MTKKFKRVAIDYLGITVGSILTAVGLAIFLIPNKIAAGGVSGLATVIYHLFNFSPGIVMLIINIPLFLFGVKVIGKHMGARTFYGIIALSVSLEFLAPYLPVLTHDPLLASLYGGGLAGLGIGLVFKSKGTTGGTDLMATLLHHFFPAFSIGQGLLIIDAMVVTLAGIAFNAELALYAVVSLFVTSKVIDLVQEGFNLSKAVFIISDYSDEIKEEIFKTMGRGVTYLNGRGGYTGKEKNVLLAVVSRAEVTGLKRLVYRTDPKSFVILTEVHEVMGEGFREFNVD